MKQLFFTFCTVLFSLNIGFSCMWDYDTYAMEKEQFPTIEELMSGNFLRHSPEYHQWRIKDREQKLKHYPDSIQFYDDMAVSYSKLGEDETAIKLMLKKETLKPNLYETYANLGTFYIHNKELEKGIKYIDKAIEINPKAHFGREIYQGYVAEYVLLKKRKAKIYLPLNKNSAVDSGPKDFCLFLIDKLSYPDSLKVNTLPDIEIRKAIKGISGMMRFGNYDSPVLLEILSDLLLYNYVGAPRGGFSSGAKHFVAMALLRAGRKQSPQVKKLYYAKAKEVIYYQRIKGVSDSGKDKIYHVLDMIKEQDNVANKNYEALRKNEIEWIGSNKNVDREYAKEYYTSSIKEEIISKSDSNYTAVTKEVIPENFLYAKDYTLIYLLFTMLFFILGFVIWKLLKRKKSLLR